MNVKLTGQRAGCLRRGFLSAVLMAGALALAPTMGAAEMSFAYGRVDTRPDDRGIFHRGEMIPEAELDTLRGGFSLGGMELNFGAKLTTLINNTIRYETEVAFRNSGMEVLSQTISNAGAGPVTLVGSGSSGVSPASIPGSSLIVGSAGGGALDLSGLSDFSGIVVEGPGGIGSTAALHRITRQAIVSTLATTASGQTIQNDIDVSVYINNIGELRAAQQKARILNSLQGVIR